MVAAQRFKEFPRPRAVRAENVVTVGVLGLPVRVQQHDVAVVIARCLVCRQDVFEGQLSNVVDLAMENDQAATFSSVGPSSWLSSSVTRMPSLNFTPSSTSATRWWPLNRRQRSCAVASSL